VLCRTRPASVVVWGTVTPEGAPCNGKPVILVAVEIAVIGRPRGHTRPVTAAWGGAMVMWGTTTLHMAGLWGPIGERSAKWGQVQLVLGFRG
jgi:hypothetical protein